MAKAAKKEKAYKLKFKPTSIARLRHYKEPLKMVGDPPHNGSWQSREKAVYEFEMDRKRFDNRGWSNALYYEADTKNRYIDTLLDLKWRVYKYAIEDNFYYDMEQAERENAAWEYENDNFVL